MPIKVEDAKKYKGYEGTEFKISKFLEKNKGNAYTSKEIRKGIGRSEGVYNPDEKGSYWTWENVGMFALLLVHDLVFDTILERMVEDGKIRASEVGGKEYYYLP